MKYNMDIYYLGKNKFSNLAPIKFFLHYCFESFQNGIKQT